VVGGLAWRGWCASLSAGLVTELVVVEGGG
jgi:hypothetical protein